MNAPADSPPVTVALLALPESTPATLYGLYEVFSAVGVTWLALTGEPAAGPRMDARIVSLDGTPLNGALGLPITPHAALSAVQQTDLLIVTDSTLPLDTDPRRRWPVVADWIRRQFAQGATVCSVCTGSVLLAEAGLLDGAEATTHWCAVPLFHTYYPAVKLRPKRILVPSGPAQRLITSGGSAAWEDLALYLIARYCGEVEAVRAAKIFLFGDRSEGQMLYAARARPRRHDDALVARCQDWIAEHYSRTEPGGLPGRLLRVARAHLHATLHGGDRLFSGWNTSRPCGSRRPNNSSKPPANRPTSWPPRSVTKTRPSFAGCSSGARA